MSNATSPTQPHEFANCTCHSCISTGAANQCVHCGWERANYLHSAERIIEGGVRGAILANVEKMKDTNPKDAIGSSKPPLTPVSAPVMFLLGLGMLEGGCKYRRHNYRVAGVRSSVYVDATMRHMWKYWEGEDIDPDSGLPHLAKAMASIAVLLDSTIQGNVNDDRPPKTDPKFWVTLEKMCKDLLAKFPNPKPPYTAKGD